MEGGAYRVRLARITAHDFDLIKPGHVAQVVGIAGEHAHLVANGQQFGHESAADVSGRPSHEAQLTGRGRGKCMGHSGSVAGWRAARTLERLTCPW